MAAKKKTAREAAARPGRARKASAARKRIAPSKEPRGLASEQVVLAPDASEIAPLVADIRAAGGAIIGAYHEPLTGKPLVVAALPRESVQPTPFQRDLSPTHAKRLAAKIEESAAFLDPLIVVRGQDGALWTPNGRHRLAAAKVLGLRMVTALVSPDEGLAFKILALNTEKAHNLKDRSLEVIRMARALAAQRPRARETDFAAELESPELLTLGLIYEQEGRFAGGAYSPFLKKIDRFATRTLPVSLRQRQDWAARLLDIDTRVKDIVAKLGQRGFRSPYLRNFVVARINPVRFHRAPRGKKQDGEPPMAMGAALTRMAAAARDFDLDTVSQRDVALVAAAVAG